MRKLVLTVDRLLGISGSQLGGSEAGDMKVFISWSGDRSREIGELLDWWLQCVIQVVEPWMSSKDIDRGSLWFSELNDQLKDTTIGILCLTQANKEKPWILFEAGALAKGLSSNRVCTFLIDLSSTDISGPLAQFNHTMPDRNGVLNLVKTLNTSLGDKALKEKILEKVFDTYWPQFDVEFTKIIGMTANTEPIVKRTNDEILAELLVISRGLEKRIRGLETNRGLEIPVKTPENISKDKETVGTVPGVTPKTARRMIEEMVLKGHIDEDILQAMNQLNAPLHVVETFIREIRATHTKDS